MAAAERLGQRRLVHESAPRRVHQDRARAHGRKLPAADEPAVLLGERNVQRDRMAGREEFVQACEFHPQIARTIRAHEGIVGHDAHPERPRPPHDLRPDPPESDHAERLPAQLDPAQLLAPPLSGADARVRLRDPAGRGEEQGEGEFGRGLRVRRGRVEHGDSATRGGGDVDVVHTHARAPHDPQHVGGLDEVGGHLRAGSHDERRRAFERAAERLAIRFRVILDREAGGGPQRLDPVREEGIRNDDAKVAALRLAHVISLTGLRRGRPAALPVRRECVRPCARS